MPYIARCPECLLCNLVASPDDFRCDHPALVVVFVPVGTQGATTQSSQQLTQMRLGHGAVQPAFRHGVCPVIPQARWAQAGTVGIETAVVGVNLDPAMPLDLKGRKPFRNPWAAACVCLCAIGGGNNPTGAVNRRGGACGRRCAARLRFHARGHLCSNRTCCCQRGALPPPVPQQL